MKDDLTTEEIYFLARVKKIEAEYLKKIKPLLDPKRVRSALIRYEFRQRSSGGVLPKREVVTLLMKKYEASRSYIENIIYQNKAAQREKECVLCGRLTSYYRWSKYDGRCKKCMKR